MLGPTLSTQVGVGTPAYVTMGLTFWIGGMLLLGLSSILCGQSYVACYSSPSGNPEYPETLKGFPYRRNPDGSVAVLRPIGSRTYKSWNEFWKAIRNAP